MKKMHLRNSETPNTKKEIALTEEGAERREAADDDAEESTEEDATRENANKEPQTPQEKTTGQPKNGQKNPDNLKAN